MLADIEILHNTKTDRFIVINKINKTRNQLNYAGYKSLQKILGGIAERSFPNIKALDNYVKDLFSNI